MICYGGLGRSGIGFGEGVGEGGVWGVWDWMVLGWGGEVGWVKWMVRCWGHGRWMVR